MAQNTTINDNKKVTLGNLGEFNSRTYNRETDRLSKLEETIKA